MARSNALESEHNDEAGACGRERGSVCLYVHEHKLIEDTARVRQRSNRDPTGRGEALDGSAQHNACTQPSSHP
jgi:hypothetical protein